MYVCWHVQRVRDRGAGEDWQGYIQRNERREKDNGEEERKEGDLIGNEKKGASGNQSIRYKPWLARKNRR